MANPLVSKLEQFARLSAGERRELDGLAGKRLRRLRAHEHLIHEGDALTSVSLIVEGWAQCYKMLPDGRRQIVAFLVPGDFCDPHFLISAIADHSVAAVTSLTVAQIPCSELMGLTSHRIVPALWWTMRLTAAIQREWLLNIGQRGALERTSHLILELFNRRRFCRVDDSNGCDFPLRQTEMADALGLTSVHTNRMIQTLRKEKLIELSDKRLILFDIPSLERLAMFNPGYLHLKYEGQNLDADD